MNQYSKKIDIRWSDIDANFHLRHSVYYDLGAFLRM
jgi:acyl-CoA thioester hydrolase